MHCKVLRLLHEDGRDYNPGDDLVVKASRGWRLAELGLVKAPLPWEYDFRDEWDHARRMIGAGPSHPAFPTRCLSLRELRPGDKLLIIRKLGGLGDILIQSQLFPQLNDQYPDIEVHFAIPRGYWSLFEGANGVTIRNFSQVYTSIGPNYPGETSLDWAGLDESFLKQYAMVEDISRPCLDYENQFVRFRGIEGGPGLRWRDRLDIWANYFGLFTNDNVRTCIRLTTEEVQQARARFAGISKPVLLFAPISGSDQRSYPWYLQLEKQLSKRWAVFYLHDQPFRPNSLTGLSLRQMGAVVQAADAVLAVDTSVFHWAGLLRKPVVGLFNFLAGQARSKYFPTAKVIQACDTPCLGSKYDYCSKRCPVDGPAGPQGRSTSWCYLPEHIDLIVKQVEALCPSS